MLIEKMDIIEIKKYYNKKYSKILNFIIKNEKYNKLEFSIDKDCSHYLELFGKSKENENFYLKINHGISNSYPYNTWFKSNRFKEIERNRFRNQEDVIEYLTAIKF